MEMLNVYIVVSMHIQKYDLTLSNSKLTFKKMKRQRWNLSKCCHLIKTRRKTRPHNNFILANVLNAYLAFYLYFIITVLIECVLLVLNKYAIIILKIKKRHFEVTCNVYLQFECILFIYPNSVSQHHSHFKNISDFFYWKLKMICVLKHDHTRIQICTSGHCRYFKATTASRYAR